MKTERMIVVIGRVTKEADPGRERHRHVPVLSIIRIHKRYVKGLDGLKAGHYLDVVYLFHKSKRRSLTGMILSGEEKGIFATRSPARPSKIGITRVMLHAVNDHELVVSGLDAMRGSPVIDIKPCDRIT